MILFKQKLIIKAKNKERLVDTLDRLHGISTKKVEDMQLVCFYYCI